jgi:hypothetical protein
MVPFLSSCFVLAALHIGQAEAADPTANWPATFYANFTENFADGRAGSGFWALDMSFNGGQGAQTLLRTDGTVRVP